MGQTRKRYAKQRRRSRRMKHRRGFKGGHSKSITFISYANENFKTSRERISNEAKEMGCFKKIQIYSPTDLSPDFLHKVGNVIRESRGGGYWIWKPYIIHDMLNKLNENDILLYADAGCTLHKTGMNRFHEYMDMISPTSGCSVLAMRHKAQMEKRWTSSAIFDYFDISLDNPIANQTQICATVSIWRKCPESLAVVKKWLEIAETRPDLFTDVHNEESKKRNPEFEENRHDQSIFSMVTQQPPYNKTVKVIEEEIEGPQNPTIPFTASRQRGGNPTGNCIFVKILGGLGNRLFIYAASLYVKQRILEQNKIDLPICFLDNDNANFKYVSELFKQGTPYTEPDVTARLDKAHNPFNDIQNDISVDKPYFNYKTKDVKYESGDVCLPLAYYQNYEGVKSTILAVKSELIPIFEKKYPDLKQSFHTKSNESAFMHVRRGDYKEYSLPKKYYQDGLDILHKDSNVKHLYILSNDINWCKEQKWNTFALNVHWIDNNDDLYCLYLMSLCLGGAILSGSTFSLWGVFLGVHENKSAIITYPSEWFMNKSYNLDLPKEWTKIQIMEDVGFIVLRCVKKPEHNILYKECYMAIRKYHPDLKIVFIDDNSDKTVLDNNIEMTNVEIIHSEHPGAGEYLAYLFLLEKKPFKKAIFLQDSMILNSKIPYEDVNDFMFLYQFVNSSGDNKELFQLFENTKVKDKLREIYDSGNWKGCWGSMMVITDSFVERLENEVGITKWKTIINSREFRIALEEAIAIACIHLQGMNRKLSIFGEIKDMQVMKEIGNTKYTLDMYLADKSRIKDNIIKIWNAR